MKILLSLLKKSFVCFVFEKNLRSNDSEFSQTSRDSIFFFTEFQKVLSKPQP